MGKNKKDKNAQVSVMTESKATGLYKVIYHGSIQARPTNDDAQLAFAELTAKASRVELNKIVLRCSLFSFQAKWWPSGQYILDLNCTNLRLVSTAGRSVTLVFKDPGVLRSSSLTAQHTMYAFYCESEEVAFKIASSMLQIARTITAALRELKYAGSVEKVKPQHDDFDKYVTNFQPDVDVNDRRLPNYGLPSPPETIIFDLIIRQGVSISSKIERLTDKTFTSRLKALDVAVVIFMLPDNQYCRMVEGQLERAAPKLLTLSPPVHVCKVNLNTDYKQAKKLGITPLLVPVMAIYKNGKAGSYDGPDDSAGIVAYMKAYVNQGSGYGPSDHVDPMATSDYAAAVDCDTRHLRTAIEDEDMRQLISQVSEADVAFGVHNSIFSAVKSQKASDLLRSIQCGEAQPNRTFVRALAKSIRLGLENSDLILMEEMCQLYYFDSSTKTGWSPPPQAEREAKSVTDADLGISQPPQPKAAWSSPDKNNTSWSNQAPQPSMLYTQQQQPKPQKKNKAAFIDPYVEADAVEPGVLDTPERWSSRKEDQPDFGAFAI